jgi:hypothetical protein
LTGIRPEGKVNMIVNSNFDNTPDPDSPEQLELFLFPPHPKTPTPPNTNEKSKRILGFFLLAIFLTNIVLNLVGISIYKELPYCAGEVAKITPNTSEKVFWGVFYATGNGRVEYVETPPSEFNWAEWVVIARDLPGKTREVLVKNGGDWTMGYGPMNVNLRIPHVKISESYVLHLQVVIDGYVARKINSTQFVYDRVEMRSVPFTLGVVPDKLKWFVHQDDYVPISLIGIFFSIGGLIIKKKK